MFNITSTIKKNRLGFWAYDLSKYEQIALILSFSILTGISAQIRIYLWFTPVPITLQVFCVLLGGITLGSKNGSLSQIIYLGLGIIGVPWFSGGNNGIEYFLGYTGGYIIGFILAAALVGYQTENLPDITKTKLILTNLVGVGIIYLIGGFWLASICGLTLWNAFLLGVAPFIVLDLMKATIAAYGGAYLLPKN
ncbi:MAG: biotin transporter BioY [Candidatus Kariarchaeaceae archaeon]